VQRKAPGHCFPKDGRELFISNTGVGVKHVELVVEGSSKVVLGLGCSPEGGD
jgi:hypothetical protein